MKTMNRVFLIGNLGHDPEMRVSEKGVSYTRLRIATHRSWEKDGKQEQTVQWHSVYVWGGLAQTCTQWLSKGSLVFIEGELRQVEPREDQPEGRPFSLIHALEVKFLNSRQANLDNRPRPGNHDAVAQR